MSSVAQRLMTAEEFWHSPLNGKQTELVCGRVKDRSLPGIRHGMVSAALGSLLYSWAHSFRCGRIGLRAGCITAHNPDTVRGPDILYIRANRVPPDGTPDGFWPFAPDLAVEIVSRGETGDEVSEKVREYFSAGTLLVWVIHPCTHSIVVYAPDGVARTYSENSTLERPDLLPGFSCKVAELFM